MWSYIFSVARIWKKKWNFWNSKGRKRFEKWKTVYSKFYCILFIQWKHKVGNTDYNSHQTHFFTLIHLQVQNKLSRMLNPTGGQMCKKLHVWWLNHLQTFAAVCLHLSFNNYYKDKGCRSESWHFVKNCEEVMNEGEELTMFCQGRG